MGNVCCGGEHGGTPGSKHKQEKPTAGPASAPSTDEATPQVNSAFLKGVCGDQEPAQTWLAELGLPQYADAFCAAGYSDWELLGSLDAQDLVVGEALHACTQIVVRADAGVPHCALRCT
jgi:hypothetical protein